MCGFYTVIGKLKLKKYRLFAVTGANLKLTEPLYAYQIFDQLTNMHNMVHLSGYSVKPTEPSEKDTMSQKPKLWCRLYKTDQVHLDH